MVARREETRGVETERAKRTAGPGRGKVGVSALPTLPDAPPTLTDLGITKRESVEAQVLAALSQETFVEVGLALLEIRDRRLYRLTHSSFATYCEERWQFSETYGTRLIQAAEVVQALPIGKGPFTESQARELARVQASPAPQSARLSNSFPQNNSTGNTRPGRH
jgi:hypothetical protein